MRHGKIAAGIHNIQNENESGKLLTPSYMPSLASLPSLIGSKPEFEGVKVSTPLPQELDIYLDQIGTLLNEIPDDPNDHGGKEEIYERCGNRFGEQESGILIPKNGSEEICKSRELASN